MAQLRNRQRRESAPTQDQIPDRLSGGGENPLTDPSVPWYERPGVEVDFNEPIAGRGGETPRERSKPGGGAGGAAPTRPRSPQPMAGSTFQAGMGGGMGSGGVMPFDPMGGSPDVGSLATPRLRGLFGGAGGLTEGGLGVPLDPTSDLESDPISTLLKLLQGGM